jgi:hypothetical protein
VRTYDPERTSAGTRSYDGFEKPNGAIFLAVPARPVETRLYSRAGDKHLVAASDLPAVAEVIFPDPYVCSLRTTETQETERCQPVAFLPYGGHGRDRNPQEFNDVADAEKATTAAERIALETACLRRESSIN